MENRFEVLGENPLDLGEGEEVGTVIGEGSKVGGRFGRRKYHVP